MTTDEKADSALRMRSLLTALIASVYSHIPARLP